MVNGRSGNSRRGVLRDIAAVGGRAASATLRPLGAVAEAGLGVELRAIDRLLEGGELERLLGSARLQAVLARAMESDGADRIIDSFFDSGLFDRLIDRLLASESLWHLVDVIASSPSVRAAISQQGLGFADQVAGELRTRSRNADGWLERKAARLAHRRQEALPDETDASA